MWTRVGQLADATYYGPLITASGATWPFIGLAAAALVQVRAISRKAFLSASSFAARAQRRQSSANCRYSSAVAIQRSHRYRPCAYREHKVATTSHAFSRNFGPAPD